MFEQHGITVLVDSESLDIMTGTIIDFKQSMMGGGFTIDNPNAIASCGAVHLSARPKTPVRRKSAKGQPVGISTFFCSILFPRYESII